MKYKEILRQVYEKELMNGNKMNDDLWEEMCEDDDWLKVSLKAMKLVKKLKLTSVIRQSEQLTCDYLSCKNYAFAEIKGKNYCRECTKIKSS